MCGVFYSRLLPIFQARNTGEKMTQPAKPGELFRMLPKVDELLKRPEIANLSETSQRSTILSAVREVLEALRHGIAEGRITSPDELSTCAFVAEVTDKVNSMEQRSLRTVVNGTGVILHTNLGRAALSERAARAAFNVGSRFSTLEYDIDAGSRGNRHSHIERLICSAVGSEAAMAVNNNAAAVLLVLSALVSGREAIVSRGELVEIGGAFRVPDIMVQCGGTLREVGTTNKTRLSDYESAVCENTAAILKVHTSNFKIVGFTESVEIDELCSFAHSVNLPVIHDIGSGVLFDTGIPCLKAEPTVSRSIRAGADVVCFSGDKLLGGPQAGIIAGKKVYIEKLKHHPLARALRVDKMTLAALEETLFSWKSLESALHDIPTLHFLSESGAERQNRADELASLLRETSGSARVCVVSDNCQVGGGSVPGEEQESYAVCIDIPGISPAEIELFMRTRAPVPVIGHLRDDKFLLNIAALNREDFGLICTALKLIGG